VPAERAEIQVGERVLASTGRGIHVAPEDRRIGYVPQGYGLFPHLDVRANVAFGLAMRGVGAGERDALATRALRELGCEHLAARRVAGLSGGERQRVALARVLVLEPDLLLLDEPLAALDALTRQEVRGFLTKRLRRVGCPTVLVTHDVRDVASIADSVCVFDGGRIIQRGSLEALRAAPSSDLVAALVEP